MAETGNHISRKKSLKPHHRVSLTRRGGSRSRIVETAAIRSPLYNDAKFAQIITNKNALKT